MSGSDSITSASMAAMTAALISLLSIPSTSFRGSDVPLSGCTVSGCTVSGCFFEDLFHRPHRARQGLADRVGQAHPGADVGGLAGHHQAAPGAAAERGEQRETVTSEPRKEVQGC